MPEKDSSKGDRLKRNVEWTLFIVIASAALGTAFFAWKRGSDRAACILNIGNVQNSVRSYAGVNNKYPGEPLNYREIMGPGNFIEQMPQCPAGGAYRLRDRVPNIGQLYMECSLCDKPYNHKPDSYTHW